MNIILSIKKEFAEKILLGTKRYEYRKRGFRYNIERALMYVTSPHCLIIGEFHIECILVDLPKRIWQKTFNDSGISEEYFYQYYYNSEIAYALKISSPLRYDTPFKLEDFNIYTPPQSFVYLKN